MAEPRLSSALLSIPIAHRGLHAPGSGRQENSLPAFEAAVAAGYGIELDLQLSRDGEAMVFHDETLLRLTGRPERVDALSAEALSRVPLLDGAGTIPTLAELLSLVAGQVPLLIELKDQDGALGDGIGPLETAVANALRDYSGDCAVMSFNPHAVARLATLLPGIPRGRVTETFRESEWPDVPAARRAELDRIDDLAALGASFISHGRGDLADPRVADLKAGGTDILTWTIRSEKQEAAARRIAQNITFEAYLPALPA